MTTLPAGGLRRRRAGARKGARSWSSGLHSLAPDSGARIEEGGGRCDHLDFGRPCCPLLGSGSDACEGSRSAARRPCLGCLSLVSRRRPLGDGGSEAIILDASGVLPVRQLLGRTQVSG